MPDAAHAVTAAPLGTLATLPLHRIIPDPHQPRRLFEDEGMESLTASIRELGVLQPITVRPKLMGEIGEGDYDYAVVAGERRLRAAKAAGLATIPAIVRDDLAADRATVAVLQLVENLQRADLTLWETAQGCRALVDAIGLEAAAQRLGYSKPWVSTRSNVGLLPEAIRDLVERGLLNDVETAHNLAALADMDEQGADTVEGWIEDIINGLPPTREDVRRELREAREQHEATAARERARQQRAEAEAAERAKGGDLELTPPDDDEDDGDDAPAARHTPRSAPESRVETGYERERRLREEAWAELMPDCKRLARESRKAAIDALASVVDKQPGDRPFEITISSPQTSAAVPAKPTGADYLVQLDGNSHDAGLLLEALETRPQRVNFSASVTVAQLRAVERLLGTRFRVSTTVAARGSVLTDITRRIRDAHEAMVRSEAQADADAEAVEAARLAAELRAEGEALANAAADPAPVVDAAEQIARFIVARAVLEDGARIKAGDLHAAYVAWCEAECTAAVPLTDNRWGQALQSLGIEKKRSNGYVYIGIRLADGGAA